MMSVLGSLFIMYEVLKDPKKRRMAYHLQMLALSIFDFLYSVAFFVWNWPAQDSGWCTARGFLHILSGTPTAMLNAGVCVYYLLFVYFAWNEEKILRYQRVLIILPIIWGLITAIVALAQGMINPHAVAGHCWLEPAPAGCTGSGCTPDEYYYRFYEFAIIQIPRWISFIVAIICMCFVYYKVSKDEREQGGVAPAGWLWFVQPEEGQDTSKNKRSRRMARQAFLYFLTFFVPYVGTTAWSIVRAIGGTVPFGLLVFTYIFLPWQGFWNAIIYVRPRYMRNREKNPNMSLWQAIMTEDEYDHRLGARAMRSTRHSGSGTGSFFGSILGSMFRKSGQGQGESQSEGQGQGQGAEAEAEAELAQVAEEGNEEA